MKTLQLTILFSLLTSFITTSFSQNLVLNPSFSDHNVCFEFNQPCSPAAWRLTSNYLPSYKGQNDDCVGIIIYNYTIRNTRSYLQARLSDTLIVGEKYKLELDIKPEDLLINEIGILLSDSLIFTKNNTLINAIPDLEFVNNTKLLKPNNKKQWLHLERDFIAKSKSLFIIIGNFYSDNKVIKKSVSRKKMFNDYFYLIDNIKLSSINNLHKDENIQKVKNQIYALNYRHPVPDTMFSLKQKKIELLSIREEIKSSNSFKKVDTISLFSDLLFQTDSFRVSKKLTTKLDSIFETINFPIDSIIVIGNTDNIGTKEYNNKLSYRRSETVAKYISTIKISYKNINYYGVGSDFPIANNTSPEGRYKNRRVIIVIKYRKNYPL